MAQVLFKASKGFADENKSYLSGSGVPGGDASFQDNSNVGSQYQDISTGNLYIKVVSGAGPTKWKMLATTDNLESLITGISWREPVIVRDSTTLTIASAIASLNSSNDIQGQSISVGSRILFSGLTTESNNVYIVGGSTGNWTLTESENSTTAGDSVQVISGTDSGKMFTYYADTGWTWSASLSTGEDEFIRSFIGKGDAGIEMPSYSTNFIVANGDSLETAIGKLDGAVNTNSISISALETNLTSTQTELNSLESSIGSIINSSTGGWTGFSSTNYLNSATSVTNAFSLLDSMIKTNSDAISFFGSLQSELDATQLGAGLEADGSYLANSSTNYISSATSLKNADELLDAKIKLLDTSSTASSSKIDAIISAVGLQSDGTLTTWSGTTYVNGISSIKAAITQLDSSISTVSGSLDSEVTRATNEEGFIRAFIGKGASGSEMPSFGSQNYVSNGTSLETNIGSLDSALKVVSDRVGNIQYSSSNIIAVGDSVTEAISKLDANLASSVAPSSVNNVTTLTEIDSVSVDSVSSAKWIYSVTLVSDESQKETGEILSLHNGTSTADANDVGFNRFAQILTGSGISGLNVTVDISGSGTNQKMRLLVSSPVAVNVRAVRIQVAL